MAGDPETITLDHDGPVAVLTLSRPQKYNAVNAAMQRDLQGALRTLAADPGVRALLVTGAGKAFCAGQDLAEFSAVDESFRYDEHVRATFNRLVLGLRELPLPVIAAVNGVAAGAGASLALACDLRICSDRASFVQAFARIGLVPDTGSTWFLPQLVGVGKALELAWTGEAVDGAEAVALGMANSVVPHEQLQPRALELAQRLASMPTRALGMTKRAIYRGATSTLPEALEYEAQLQQVASRTSDHHEGIAAFTQKRPPVFAGR